MQPPCRQLGVAVGYYRASSLPLFSMGYIDHASEGMHEYLYTLGGLFSTVDSNTLPLPWQLIAPKKAVKSSLFNVINHVCTHVDGIRYECTPKSLHKWPKKAKWGWRGR
jgi:hypothetical protein